MDAEAEFGVAAHWRYKQGGPGRAGAPGRLDLADRRDAERLAWLRQLVDWQGDLPGAQEYVETIKSDVFQDQVFAYTPKGELKDMTAGSTPLDLAFRIHTDLGYACVGAKVNGRLVALTTPLSNGDVVEIVTSRNSRGPSRDWLNPALGYLKTNHARTKVRQWFRKRQRTENLGPAAARSWRRSCAACTSSSPRSRPPCSNSPASAASTTSSSPSAAAR